ncbi:MAG: M14 family zinc carboxypeptidase [Planctomycetota bacterium]
MRNPFRILVVFLLLALCFTCTLDAKQIIRITAESRDALAALPLPKGMEIAGSGANHVDFLVSSDELANLERRGISFTVIDDDVQRTLNNQRAGYPSFSEIESKLQSTASTYSNITSLFSLGQSYQGRDIWCLEISDNPGVDEGETEMIFIGLHHAREWPSVVVTLFIIDQLTQGYGINPTITNYVNTRRIWVVPCQNPDGYYYCHDQSHDWRKNRHYFPSHGTYGVDLNRNYPGATNGTSKGDWGSIGTASVTHWPDDETYCGPGAGSELETQAIMNFVMAHDPTTLVTYHTYSELVLWPYGYDNNAKAPDDALLKSTGQAMATRIAGMSGGTYTPQQSAGLYPVTGDTVDWSYGEGYYVHGLNVLPYTIELCTSFQPSYSQLTQVCNENWDAVEYLLDEADNLRGAMTPFVLPPALVAPETDPDGNYTINWTVQNPDSNPVYFLLEELSGLSVGTDNAEAGSGRWNLDGFSLVTSKSHSTTHSYMPVNQDSRTSTMTTKYPVPVSAGDSLQFWTWYDIETDWDFAFVEVSKDKRKWHQLEQFTGNTGSAWRLKGPYSLAAFEGESLYIRFRYTTDQNTLGSGFWVDDISLVPDFSTVTTLNGHITNTYYNIAGNLEGDYYYRVQGYSNTRGWGDFCVLDKTTVVAGSGPDVTSCIPAEGMMTGGAAVTVTGDGFTTTPDTDVFFSGEEAQNVVVLNATTLTCTTPALSHPGWVDLTVTNSTGSGMLEEGFEYTPDPGLPRNMTDIDTLNLTTLPVWVEFYTTGDAGAMYILLLSLGGGPTNTPFGVMGLDVPYYWLVTSFIGIKGYEALDLQVPDVGPLEFYLHALVDDSPPRFAAGGNNPNGTHSVKFVLD